MGRTPGPDSAREDAPTEREYRRLRKAAEIHLKDPFRVQCSFALVAMGELGLRAGELCHITREWVDLDNCKIRIPRYDACTYGRNGGICGYCQKRAKSAAERDSELSFEEAKEQRWEPKMEASTRVVPYSWNPDAIDEFDRFFAEYDSYEWSRASVNRRINRVAKATDTIDKNDVYPHALRGHAARQLARRGMRVHALRKFMGWSSLSAPLDYIRTESNDVEAELERVFRDRSHF